MAMAPAVVNTMHGMRMSGDSCAAMQRQAGHMQAAAPRCSWALQQHHRRSLVQSSQVSSAISTTRQPGLCASHALITCVLPSAAACRAATNWYGMCNRTSSSHYTHHNTSLPAWLAPCTLNRTMLTASATGRGSAGSAAGSSSGTGGRGAGSGRGQGGRGRGAGTGRGSKTTGGNVTGSSLIGDPVGRFAGNSTTAPPSPPATASPKAAKPSAAAPAAGSNTAAAPGAGQYSKQYEEQYAAAIAAAKLSPAQVGQLESYLDYMLETNKVMNLTAVRDPGEARVRHLADSLALLPVIDAHAAPAQAGQPLTVIDVGTGAGLPGMVLAVARPGWRVTLLDSLRKRCDFLTRAAELIGAANVQVVWARAEEGGRNEALRDAHDVAVARAVADTRVLAELCLPFVRAGGTWVAAKGPEPEAEVAAAKTALKALNGSLVGIERVTSAPQPHTAAAEAAPVPTAAHAGIADLMDNGQSSGAAGAPPGARGPPPPAGGPFTAVVVKKTGSTPAKYPRAPGTPNKTPL